MGGGISRNVLNAIATVTNRIQSDSSATSDQVTSCVTNFRFDRCVVGGDLNATDVCNIYVTSQQVINKITNDNLKNFVAQNLLQEAQSTVGALGVGYAEASNITNTMVNSTNSIVNSVSIQSSQNFRRVTDFRCVDSVIRGNLNFGVTTDVNFLSSQVLQLRETNEIASNISQTVEQRATATVGGIAGFLIALAILIVAVGWVLFRPLQLALGSRMFIVILIVVTILGLLLAAYFLQWPPLFNPPTYCVPIIGALGSCSGDIECVDVQMRTIKTETPPTRYAFDIIGSGDTSLGQSSANFTPGLLQMAISRAGGWNKAAYDDFRQNSAFEGLPNPLVESFGVYKTNVTEWRPYLQIDRQAGHARYVLANYLGIDTSVRIFEYEECSGDTCYTFVPGIVPQNVSLRVMTGGTLTGSFGVCNTASNRFQGALRIIGLVFGGIVLLSILLFILFYRRPSA